MIGIHSVFNSESRFNIYNTDKELNVIELYTWVYSILSWKKSGNKILLYCDKKIEEFVTKYGFNHLYDEIRVREYNDDVHKCFWSYNKIRVLEEIHEPVCLFDIDTFFRDTSFTELHYDMLCYHREYLGIEYYDRFYNNNPLIQKLSYFEPLTDEFKTLNACMVVFNSYDLKTEFIKNAKETVETIKVLGDDEIEYGTYTIFMEQVNLGYLYQKYDCAILEELLFDEKRWGLYVFNSEEPVAHLGNQKYDLEKVGSLTRDMYIQVMKDKIIEEGYPRHSTLFHLTNNEQSSKENSLIPQRVKPTNRPSIGDVTNNVFDEWYNMNMGLIQDDRFQLAFWGSINGRDVDMIVTNKVKMSIKELEDYMLRLTHSGNEYGITIELLYTSNMDYFREFRMENSKKVYDDVFIGYISEHPYETNGRTRRYGNMVFYSGPFNDAYYQCTDKNHDVLFIDNIRDIKNNDGYTHFSSEVYNTIYERFGIFSIID